MAPSPATVSCDLTGEQRESLTQNVMLTRGPNGDRVAMLGDFGLSKRLEDTLDMAKTCIGSPFYMVRASRRGGGRWEQRREQQFSRTHKPLRLVLPQEVFVSGLAFYMAAALALGRWPRCATVKSRPHT